MELSGELAWLGRDDGDTIDFPDAASLHKYAVRGFDRAPGGIAMIDTSAILRFGADRTATKIRMKLRLERPDVANCAVVLINGQRAAELPSQAGEHTITVDVQGSSWQIEFRIPAARASNGFSDFRKLGYVLLELAAN